MRLFLLTVALFFAALSANSQTITDLRTLPKKSQKRYLEGRTAMRQHKLSDAVKTYEKVLDDHPTFITAWLEKGASELELYKFAEAEQSFQNVVELDPEYEAEVYFLLSRAQEEQEKYTESKANLVAFFDRIDADHRLYKATEQKIQQLDFFVQNDNQPFDFKPFNLGKEINTSQGEYFPSFTADGETFIFTRRTRGNEDLYTARKVNDQWTLPKPIPGFDSPQNEGGQTIAADGKTIVFTGCNLRDGLGSCDLYWSRYKNGVWTPFKNMGAGINTSDWDSQPSLSADGQLLYFSSSRPNGQGLSDIYVSRRLNDDQWSQPVNLGPTINTSGKDQTPFFHADGQTLYFSSDGHPGVGNADLFLSSKQDTGWSTPSNLGPPLNTKGDEGSLYVDFRGTTGYYSSTKAPLPHLDFYGAVDIYAFELPEALRPKPVTYVRAKVIDAETKAVLPGATLSLNDLQQLDQATRQWTTDYDGEVLTVLITPGEYSYVVQHSGYLLYSVNFALADNTRDAPPHELIIPLQPVKKKASQEAKPIVLENIFFKTASAELLPKSIPEIETVKQLLTSNPTLRVRFNGHTDAVGTEADNLALSENRAKAVYQYLVENGIDADRMTYKGFGESQPIADNETEAGRKKNRRTEFQVID